MKNLAINHIDLDAFGCMIQLMKIFPDYEMINTDYGCEDIQLIRDKMLEADNLIISDLSVSPEFAKILNDQLISGEKLSLLILDHHESAKLALDPLGYDWIHIDLSKSGALLVWEYFKDKYPELIPYEEFARNVSDYDLWEFKLPHSKSLQFLWSSDKEKFTHRFLNDPSLSFSDDEMSTIMDSYKVLDNSYNSLKSNMSDEYTDEEGLKFRYISRMERLNSLATSKLLDELDGSVDYLVIFNQYSNSLSFRSRGSILVNKIAELLGGGGHANAAGAPVPSDGIYNLIESIKNYEWIKLDIMSRSKEM